MSIVDLFHRLAAALIVGSGILAAPARAQPVLTSLAAIQPGLWEYRVAGEAPRALCLATADALVRVRHPGNACSQLVVADDPTAATVHYSCPGANDLACLQPYHRPHLDAGDRRQCSIRIRRAGAPA